MILAESVGQYYRRTWRILLRWRSGWLESPPRYAAFIPSRRHQLPRIAPWPMVNVYNRRLTYEKVPEIMLSGPVPAAPLNQLGMLSDYIVPEERIVACPNQDVVYGVGALALDVSPAVIQVPDFGDRFWVYQIVDARTDSFADLGKMYGSTPGFYLLVGPNWKGEVPKGITKVFRASTNTGYVIPRVFQDDSPEDNKAVQTVTQQIIMYPLAEFDGTMKSRDWSQLQKLPSAASG